jgi:hypothetical protein
MNQNLMEHKCNSKVMIKHSNSKSITYLYVVYKGIYRLIGKVKLYNFSRSFHITRINMEVLLYQKVAGPEKETIR